MEKKTSKVPPIVPRKCESFQSTLTSLPSFRLDDLLVDEFHPRATRRLLVGNLDKDVTREEIARSFGTFGSILDIDVQRLNFLCLKSSTAIIEYTTITAVIEAMTYFKEESKKGCHLQCDFAYKQPKEIIWIDASKNNESPFDCLTDSLQILSSLQSFGALKKFKVSADKHSLLIHYETVKSAQCAVSELHGEYLGLSCVQVDYADEQFEAYFNNSNVQLATEGDEERQQDLDHLPEIVMPVPPPKQRQVAFK